MFAEIILENMRQNNSLKGILISEKEVKTSVIYTVNISSLIHLEMQLIHFEKVTDTKYNKTKCLGIWIGSKKGDRRKPLGFKWNSVSIEILGYTYGHNTNKYGNKTEKKQEKNPKGYTEVGTFTIITHRKESINKPNHAK